MRSPGQEDQEPATTDDKEQHKHRVLVHEGFCRRRAFHLRKNCQQQKIDPAQDVVKDFRLQDCCDREADELQPKGEDRSVRIDSHSRKRHRRSKENSKMIELLFYWLFTASGDVCVRLVC
mmetsp:Transcript_20989/g.23529  ORF Transcript_20989/g.23529 Transcript_20989/m.23529 type:complete len:120 (-) Transcript_20989:65-424(-)